MFKPKFKALVELIKQNILMEVINAPVRIQPDSEGFKSSMEQEEDKKEDSDDSDGSDDSADSDKSDPTTELPKFWCPLCMSSFDHHEEKCEETEPEQKLQHGRGGYQCCLRT